MKFRYADFNIEIKDTQYNMLSQESRDYVSDFEVPDTVFDISQKDIEYENSKSTCNFIHKPAYLHYISVYRKIAEWLPVNNAFVLHSAVLDVDGQGVAFAAHSGVGKTTHMENWISYLGDKVTIVNGDKPIVRFFDDSPETPFAYGTPWCGKEKLGCNMRTPLKHICFIERSRENYVAPVDKKDAVDRIFNQVYMPKDPMAAVATMKLIDRLLSCCRLWVIHCNKDVLSAETAYKEIFLV